ncbi:high light inducible protein [Hassallia byssoidea VB512170]|uniref:High light inducible protein n=1 Tax=Hassallia byssoidea VB512170 TaxID=1304833 RepID=A0A846HBH5_9CYAN|nr:high light inducible protein [Hassalia byssoidea VB512170]
MEPSPINAAKTPAGVSNRQAKGPFPTDATETSYNGSDRNAFEFGFTPQAELWNGRFAMIGFLAYLLWDLNGYSVVRDVLHLVSYAR